MLKFYEKYRHDDIIWAAVPATIVILLCSLVGIFGNANIVIASMRKK